MAKQIITFETTDGKKFDNEVEANGHEFFLANKPRILAYIQAAGLEKAQATLAIRNITGFLAWDEATPADVLVHEEPKSEEQPA